MMAVTACSSAQAILKLVGRTYVLTNRNYRQLKSSASPINTAINKIASPHTAVQLLEGNVNSIALLKKKLAADGGIEICL